MQRHTNLRSARLAPWTLRAGLLTACGLATPAFGESPASAPAAGSASAPAWKWTARDVVEMRRISDARISPDGSAIAYIRSVPRSLDAKDDGGAYSELFLTAGDGAARPMIIGKVSVNGVRWTPDGAGLSLRLKRGDDKHNALYFLPKDGGEARKVLGHESSIGDYDWSPDGRMVAFAADPKEPKDAETKKKRGFTQEIYEEDWKYSSIWIGTACFDADAKHEHDAEKPRELKIEGHITNPRFSPDGKRLLVDHTPTPAVDDDMMKKRLWIVDAANGNPLVKIANPGKLGDADWSPDGKWIAFISAADLNDPSAGRLMIANATSGEFKDPLPDLAGDVKAFAWQDADTVMYIGDVGTQTILAKIDADGGGAKTILEGMPQILGSISLSSDGQKGAFVADAPAHPGELFAMNHGETALRRLTDSNKWLSEKPMARQEVIEHTARDGTTLQGILFHPLTGAKPAPLVMVVHGGPEAHNSNGWLTRYANPSHLLCERGYAVFFPNYRGSTGRGVAFSKMGQHDEAGKEFDDLVDAVDHLAKAGIIDRAKVGVTGGSYGGFATAWCSTKLTEHFAAGVMFVGISDLISKSGTTDIPNEMYLVHARAWPWDEWEDQLNRSPIRWAGQSKTPLLIMHGKDDPRVHPSQSLELYRYMKVQGKTVRLVWYPGEGHGNRKLGAQYDYCLRLTQWMDHYLKGPGGAPPAHELDYGIASEKEDDKK
ncbi:MAG: S9 family peptidase [Phycisphaerae bacterium]|nr:S9 family peptidase [Phycisphaerae bacterium]